MKLRYHYQKKKAKKFEINLKIKISSFEKNIENLKSMYDALMIQYNNSEIKLNILRNELKKEPGRLSPPCPKEVIREQIHKNVISSQLPARKQKICVFSDEVGKGLGVVLRDIKRDVVVQVHSKPRAPFSEVVKDIPDNIKTMEKNDILIILTGNTLRNSYTNNCISYLKYIKSLCARKQIILLVNSILYEKHGDAAYNAWANQELFKYNYKVYEMTEDAAGMLLMDLNSMESSIFDRHGLLTTMGKSQLCINIFYNVEIMAQNTFCNLRYLTSESWDYRTPVNQSNSFL